MSTDLAIKTNQPPVDEDESTVAMPLSPASVRSYQKKKAQKSRKKPSEEQPFSEDGSESDDDGSYESDKKSDEDEDEDGFDATHLDPKFEALDGTTKLKSASDKDENEEEESSSSSDEEDGDSTETPSLRDGVADLTLDGTGTEDNVAGASDADLKSPSTAAPGIILSDGVGTTTATTTTANTTASQDSSSTGSGAASISSAALNQGQEERLQEPVKPHIALPCLVETARNPARTRITLKYSGNDHLENKSSEDQEQKISTRGRKNYMVATDLSGESWHATEWAITTILRNGDELNVVTIVEDDKGENTKGVKKGVQTEMREDAEKLTKNIHEQLEHTCLKDITVIIHIIAATRSMGAKELLIEMIDDLEDLSTVIVGSRGRGAIKGLLLGSISNFLVHNSSVPVMVVRSPKKSKGKKKMRNGRLLEHTRSVKEANLKYKRAFEDDE
ncbi:hypothetical protein BGX21_000338 [Mortierella sp. AD011]|nr:hypothetical protein BGX20_000345 [Mortierella sp. AD010]KAF9388362.1 hypothetical protein BGX21_000338 [Mortierella sp. AD011]